MKGFPLAKQKKAPNLVTLAKRIAKEFKAMNASTRSALTHAKNAGEWLAEAQVVCEELAMKWGKGVKGQFNVEERTANNYIWIYKKWDVIQGRMDETGEPLTVGQALRLMREPGEVKKQEKKTVSLNDRQKAALHALLQMRGIQVQLDSFFATMRAMGVNVSPLLKTLDLMAAVALTVWLSRRAVVGVCGRPGGRPRTRGFRRRVPLTSSQAPSAFQAAKYA